MEANSAVAALLPDLKSSAGPTGTDESLRFRFVIIE